MASTPHPGRPTGAERRRRRPATPLWLIVSAALHAALIAWLATLTVQHALRERTAAETRLVIAPEHAERLRAYLEESNLLPLREQMRELEWLREEIGQERDDRLDQLGAFEERMSTNLASRLDTLIARIGQSQAEALVGEQESMAVVDRLVPLRDAAGQAAARDALAAAHGLAPELAAAASAVREPQVTAVAAQERALAFMKDAHVLVEWIPSEAAPRLWSAAMDAQRAAAAALEESRSAVERTAETARAAGDELAKHAPLAEELKQKLALMEAEREQRLAQARVQTDAALAQAAHDAEAATRAVAATADADAAVKLADRTAREARDAAGRAEATARARKTPESQAAAEAARAHARELDAALAQQRATATAAREASGQAATVARAAEKAARDARREVELASKPLALSGGEQNTVRAAQRAAAKLAGTGEEREKLDAAMAAQRTAQAALSAAAQAVLAAAQAPLTRYAPAASAAPPAAFPTTDVASLFSRARAAETELAERYREARAAELAMMQAMTMDTAMANTRVPVSDHAQVDERTLAADVRTAQDLRRFEQAFQAADRELRGMVATATSMRDTLVASSLHRGGTGDGGSLAGLLRHSANLRQLDGLSRELSGREQDLSAAMRAVSEAAPAAPGAGGTGRSATPAPDSPMPLGPNFRGVSARTVAGEGAPAAWFFVGSWYVIGPFPNEERRNIDAVFPPESVIDLDAIYTGKGGVPVRWQHMASEECRIVPPAEDEYAIYYAWTEIRMEEACDLWIAIGSDDRSDLWINDLPVWRSVNQLKNWNLAEGYRKVHFRQGRNTVLVRLENGWHGCCFSLLVCTRSGGGA